jgi:hypothetical protein
MISGSRYQVITGKDSQRVGDVATMNSRRRYSSGCVLFKVVMNIVVFLSVLFNMRTSAVLNFLQVHTHASPWINSDIRPMPPSRRQWGKLAFMSFWAINQIVSSPF